MIVQHNITAMNANRMLGLTTGALAKSSEKLSSGYRINRAADDAAGLTISEKMRKQIRGLDQASTNAEDGVSAVQTAEGALTEVHSMLQRMNELAVQASNGTNSEADRQAIQDEIEQLTTEIDRVSETTKFNEIYLLKGDTTKTTKYLNGHDAGLKGTLTQTAKEATFTMEELKAGDSINIGGKEYKIGATKADASALVPTDANKTVEIDGTTYTIVATAGDEDAGANKLTSANVIAKIGSGSTVTVDGKSLTVMADDNAPVGVDDADSSVISAEYAYNLIQAELTAANNIGVDSATPATVAGVVDGDTAGTKKFVITKGQVEVQDTLSFNLHVGADADMTNKITIDIDSMSAAGLGIKGINVKDDSGISGTYAIDAIADAISTVSSQRSALGAVQNRLEHTIDNLDNVVENTTAAESRIRDTDMAEEMVTYTKNNILQQAGQSMLAQANQANQGVLSLLQ